MPATKFKCTDGETSNIGDCLVKCRLGRRCMTLPTLVFIVSTERPWDGKPSTTRLINGTMIEYLKATENYTVNPRDRAFTLLGSNHHALLSRIQGNWLSEQTQGGNVPGTPDLLEPDDELPGQYILTDYKTFGSYRVTKVLGLIKEHSFSTTEVYKRSGNWGKAGSPKKIYTFRIDPQQVDMEDEELQLNHYRRLMEQAGYTISRMQLQITVRDGGVQIARDRGITENIYLVPVVRLDDHLIDTFFETRRDVLVYHVMSGIPPRPCNDKESWSTRRCKDYCEVASFCPQGKLVAHQE